MSEKCKVKLSAVVRKDLESIVRHSSAGVAREADLQLLGDR